MNSPKLLLADDSITVRKVVELTFADEGVDVTSAVNGEEAMQKFVEIQPDIILADVNMPDPTGYQICEMIKQDEATRHIPVLLLVGSFEPFDQDEAERVGADGFMIKPFKSTRNLVEKVRELLGHDDIPVEIEVESALPFEAELGSSEPSEAELGSSEPFELELGSSEPSETDLRPSEPVDIVAETSDIDNLYANSFAETYRMATAEATDMFLGDAGMDDEMIETIQPVYDDASGDGSVPLVGAETIKAFDISMDPFDSEAAPVNGGLQPKFRIEDEEISEIGEVSDAQDYHDIDTFPDMEMPVSEADSPENNEPSDEFIALVARRVVEKLSDKVIRDIAQEAVPRIAENLIREALEEESKK